MPCAGWSLVSGYMLFLLICFCVCCSSRACSGTSSFHLWPLFVIHGSPGYFCPSWTIIHVIIQTLVFLLHVSFEKWQSVFGNWVLKTAVWVLIEGLTLGTRLNQADPCPLTLFCFALNAFLAQIKVLQQLWPVSAALMQYCQLQGIKNHYSRQKKCAKLEKLIFFLNHGIFWFSLLSF